MSCNCKKKMTLEDEYGVKEDESILSKINRYFLKFVMSLIAIALAIAVIPIMVIVAVYQIIFSKNPKIVPPKFLGKYMK